MKARVAIALLALVGFAGAASAQEVYARDGWEAFPGVEYQGGDANYPQRQVGILVLTESAISFHRCAHSGCWDFPKKGTPFKDAPIFTIALFSVQEVSANSRTRGATSGEKVFVGNLAGSKTEGFVSIVYKTASSAEAPIFKTPATLASAIEAKIRFRMEKIGLTLPVK